MRVMLENRSCSCCGSSARLVTSRRLSCCSLECYRQRLLEVRSSKRQLHIESHSRPCLVCGHAFIPYCRHHSYCSDLCRASARKQVPYAKKNRPLKRSETACLICKKTFVRIGGTQQQKTCSRECLRLYTNYRQREYRRIFKEEDPELYVLVTRAKQRHRAEMQRQLRGKTKQHETVGT